MKHSVQIPTVGESITEVFLGTWKKKSGDMVSKGDVLLEIETQKSNFELEADASGRLEIIHAEAGKKVPVGETIAYIDDSVSVKDAKVESAVPSSSKSSAPAQNDTALSPAVRKMVAEKGIDSSGIQGTGKGGRLLKSDVLNSLAAPVKSLVSTGSDNPRIVTTSAVPQAKPIAYAYRPDTVRGDKVEKATRIRLQIAEN